MDFPGSPGLSMRADRIQQGVGAVAEELAAADQQLRAWDVRRARFRRLVAAGLVANALGAAMLLVVWPLGALLIPAGAAGVLLGRRRVAQAEAEMAEVEAEIYTLKSELSKLQSLLTMV